MTEPQTPVAPTPTRRDFLRASTTAVGGALAATLPLASTAHAAGSPVRKVVLKSSGLVYGSNFQDPYCFREEDKRTRGPKTNVERSLLEVESILQPMQAVLGEDLGREEEKVQALETARRQFELQFAVAQERFGTDLELIRFVVAPQSGSAELADDDGRRVRNQ